MSTSCMHTQSDNSTPSFTMPLNIGGLQFIMILQFNQMLEWIVNHRTAFLATYVEIGRSCAAAKRLQEEHAR